MRHRAQAESVGFVDGDPVAAFSEVSLVDCVTVSLAATVQVAGLCSWGLVKL